MGIFRSGIILLLVVSFIVRTWIAMKPEKQKKVEEEHKAGERGNEHENLKRKNAKSLPPWMSMENIT